MVMQSKKKLIEKLTGVHSSKKSYYVALKTKIFETTKRNAQLEIINHLAKNIGIDMSIQEIIDHVTPRLQALYIYESLTLGLYIVENDTLTRKAVHESGPTENNNSQEAGITSARKDKDLKEVAKSDKSLTRTIKSKKPFYEHAQEHGKVIRMLVPLLVKTKVVGILEVYCPEGIDKNDHSFFHQLTDQLAVCLENARLYNELLQSKREWEITFSAVTDLLVFINKDYRIQKVNQAAVEFFTMPEKEIVGAACYRIFYGREAKCNPCLADQVLQAHKTAYLQSRTRHNRVLDIFAYPAYMDNNKPYGITYYAKDVTRLVDSIKLVSMGEMSAGVAHELNSPLTAIVGNAQLLLRETGVDEAKYQLINDIHSSGLRCRRIIKNLLTFSRQEEFTFEEVDLNEIVNSALALAAYQIEKGKIDLVVDLNPRMLGLSGSASGLEQVIVNLLLNAKDAVEEKFEAAEKNGKGRITVQTGIHPEGKLAIVAIGDNGSGIAEEHIPQVFNPFYTTKQSGKGTGLGLSVSLGIAQAHGGFIDLESTVGEGSTFSLILPLKTDATSEIEPMEDF